MDSATNHGQKTNFYAKKHGCFLETTYVLFVFPPFKQAFLFAEPQLPQMVV